MNTCDIEMCPTSYTRVKTTPRYTTGDTLKDHEHLRRELFRMEEQRQKALGLVRKACLQSKKDLHEKALRLFRKASDQSKTDSKMMARRRVWDAKPPY